MGAGYGSWSYDQTWVGQPPLMDFVNASRAASNFFAPVNDVGGYLCAQVMEAIIGFLLCQDKDLLDAYPH
jgi:hypothetical protein